MEAKAKRILILGAGVMQLPAIRAARSLGLEVLSADGSDSAPGKALSDLFAHIDLKDQAALLDFARRQKADGGLDAVFTAGTDFSAAVAYIAGQLGLPGIPHEAALNASDKSRMRAAFRKAGVPSPRFIVAKDGREALAMLDGLAYPLVVKPVDSMGARGCMRVDSDGMLAEAVRDSIYHSKSGQAIIEEYIDGPEFSIDALVWRGNIHACGVADRHIFFPPFFVEMGHTMPSAFPQAAIDEVLKVFNQGVRALGIDNGAAKGDIKLGADGKARVGEIAARLSGGYMSGWTYPYSSSVHLTEAAIRIALGQDPGNLEPKTRNIAAERAWISIPGKVRSCEGLERAKDLPCVRDIFPRVLTGDRVTFPKNNVQKCGNVIAVSAERGEAMLAAEKAAASILIFLEGGDRETRDFLSGLGSAYPPDAFSSLPRELLAELDNMPEESRLEPYQGGKPIIFPLAALSGYCGKDWQGRSLSESLDIVLRVTGAETRKKGAHFGAGFWKALIRGSYQGGVFWIEDSVGGENP